MDFTIKEYIKLIDSITKVGYSFQTFSEFLENPKNKVVMLRHDVDRKPFNSLKFANLQYDLGIKGSYYFRSAKCSWDPNVIQKINKFGHEIGYHYENLSDFNGDFKASIKNFEKTLNEFRKLVPIKTICMHGRPLSKFDNRLLWSKFNFRDYGIIGEPYYDLNFNEVLYLTDTGRKWNGQSENIRDSVKSDYSFNFKKTSELSQAFSLNSLPNQIMLTFHPERWHENNFLWVKEIMIQSIKNPTKRVLKKFR